MAKEKIDRRVKYTQAILKKTLIELMAENHISKISIKRICEIADVNRSTFYAHYRDQYDLLSELEQEAIQNIRATIFKEVLRQVTRREMFCLILEYAAQNAELFRILLNERSNSSFRKEIIKLVKELAFVEPNPDHKPHLIEYIHLFAIDGSLSVMDKWLEDGMVEPIEELADFFLTLLTPGISQLR